MVGTAGVMRMRDATASDGSSAVAAAPCRRKKEKLRHGLMALGQCNPFGVHVALDVVLHGVGRSLSVRPLQGWRQGAGWVATGGETGGWTLHARS